MMMPPGHHLDVAVMNLFSWGHKEIGFCGTALAYLDVAMELAKAMRVTERKRYAELQRYRRQRIANVMSPI